MLIVVSLAVGHCAWRVCGEKLYNNITEFMTELKDVKIVVQIQKKTIKSRKTKTTKKLHFNVHSPH